MILPPELLDAIAARLDRQSALALLTVSKEEKVKKAALSRIWRCVDVTTQQGSDFFSDPIRPLGTSF